MNLEEKRKALEALKTSGGEVKINKKALKKALLAGGLLFSNIGLGVVAHNISTPDDTNVLAITEETKEEKTYDVSVGYEFAVIDSKEEITRTSQLGIELLNNGFYSLSEQDTTLNDRSIDQATLNTTAFYEVINNADFDKLTVSERNFKRNANSVMDDFQDLAIRMGLQGQYGATIPELHNSVGHKLTRSFVQEFTTKINAYITDKSNAKNKQDYKKFIESIQVDPKYNDVDESAKYFCVIIGNLATPEVFTEYFQDLYFENIAQCIEQKDGKYNMKQKELLDAKNLLSVWYSDTMASLESNYDIKMVSPVAPGKLNAYGHKVVTEVQIQQEVRNNIAKGYDLNIAISNLNKLEKERNNNEYHQVLKSGGKNLDKPSVIRETSSERKQRIQDIKDQEKNVVDNGDTGNVIDNNNVVIEIEKDKDGDEAADLTFQQGIMAAQAIRAKYKVVDAKCIKELENHKKSDIYKKNKAYRNGFDQQMKQYVNEYNKMNEKWENRLPDEKPNGDEEKELVNKKEEDSPETNIEHKKDDPKKDNNNTNDKKEEQVKPSTPSKPTDTTNNNTDKTDKEEKLPDTYIPIGDSTYEDADDNKELVGEKVEDSEETIIDYNPEKHVSKTSTQETKTESKATSTRSQRLAAYKELRSNTEQVKNVIENQNEVGKTK